MFQTTSQLVEHAAAHNGLSPASVKDSAICKDTAYNSPVPEVLGQVGLGIAAGDQVFVFNNAASGLNKAPSEILNWNGTAWLKGLTDVTGTFTLQPGSFYLLRKNQTPSPQVSVWADFQPYLTP